MAKNFSHLRSNMSAKAREVSTVEHRRLTEEIPMPEDAQITIQMAANTLGVSNPHLIKLLESGEIPYGETGSHRQIRLTDIQAYETKRDAIRRKSLDDLAKTALREGYYEGSPIPVGGDAE